MTIKNNIDENAIKDYYEKNPEGVPGIKEIPEIFEMHQIFKKRVKKLRPKKFLDAGCGKGYMGEAVRDFLL